MARAMTTAMIFLASLSAGALAGADDARDILDASGVRGGLIVHLGCGEGTLTGALRADERYVVQGLCEDAASVDAARERVRSLGEYGPVSVIRHAGPSLPYADDTVNLIVREGGPDVAEAELLRALAPGGAVVARVGDAWKRTLAKPWPEGIDPWTHFLHDASNNAVAADRRVGPPARLRWQAGPLWTRSHEHTSSLVAMVTAGGRVYYVFDEGLTGVTSPSLPERWTLIARDAFNGVLLWKRRLPRWRGKWSNRSLRGVAPSIPRRLVAEGDRLFVTLAGDGPVSILDGATGKPLATCEGSAGADEIHCLAGVLLVLTGGDLAAFDARSGKPMWRHEGNVRPLSVAAERGKVYCQDGREVLCLTLADGKGVWKTPRKDRVSLAIAAGDVLLLAGRRSLAALEAATGKPLWSAGGGRGRGELFVIEGRVWTLEGRNIVDHDAVARDLRTGEVVERVTPDVLTPGHHLRCYQSKATERYMITPNRGVEFVSLTGAEHAANDWLRGPCRYGIMPANGLLYAPPHPCFCYPGVKLTGFNALAPAGEDRPAPPGERLTRGPAYDAVDGSAPAARKDDWPAYRRGPARHGTTNATVPPKLAMAWEAKLGGRLTPPVAAGGRVYVAQRDAHTLVALSPERGEELWHAMAGGRIDSPPTIHDGRVLFGCADGTVTCLRAADGELAWRFRAAPSDRRIVAFGQPESPWRVHGSVLVADGPDGRPLVYATAGRSTYLDGGIRVLALDPATGRLRHETVLDTRGPKRKDAEGKPFIAGYHMEGAFSDILVAQGGSIYLGQYRLSASLKELPAPYVMPDPNDKPTGMDLADARFTAPDAQPNKDYETHQRKWLERTQPKLLARLAAEHGAWSLGQRDMGLHVLATGGFLDDSWFNRTYWMYSKTWPGFYLAHRAAKAGQLLVVGPKRTYAVGAFPSRNMQSPLMTPGEKGYVLLADRNAGEAVLDYRTRGTTKGWGYTRKDPPVWHRWVPVRIRAMALAGETLFVAGPPDVVDPDDPMAAFEGRKGARLRAFAAEDGEPLGELELAAPPVFDGLIAIEGRLLMATTDGRVVCLGSR